MNNSTANVKTGRPNYSARKVVPQNNIAAGSGMPPGALPFNSVVQLMEESEARKQARERAMRYDEAKARAELSGIYVPKFRAPKKPSRADAEDDEYYAPPAAAFVPPRGADYEGFEEVKKKTRKPKRELTTSELNRKMAEPPSDDEEEEYNGELFDNARQHEHL
jgi:hypothetical protein